MEVKSISADAILSHIAVQKRKVTCPQFLSGQAIAFRAALQQSTLYVVNDKKSLLIKKINEIIIELVYYTEEPLPINFSAHLSERLGYDYTYLANIFSEALGTSIEKYIIAKKIERVKELLVLEELKLTEIASKLHYSSVAHISAQFKRVTGITPSHFRAYGKRFCRTRPITLHKGKLEIKKMAEC